MVLQFTYHGNKAEAYMCLAHRVKRANSSEEVVYMDLHITG